MLVHDVRRDAAPPRPACAHAPWLRAHGRGAPPRRAALWCWATLTRRAPQPTRACVGGSAASPDMSRLRRMWGASARTVKRRKSIRKRGYVSCELIARIHGSYFVLMLIYIANRYSSVVITTDKRHATTVPAARQKFICGQNCAESCEPIHRLHLHGLSLVP